MKIKLKLAVLFCIVLLSSCTKQEISKLPTESVAVKGTGSVTVISDIAGIILIDGKETRTRIKSNGTTTINDILNGDTEVAVKLDDGTIIRAADMVLVRSGETVTVRIRAPAKLSESKETPVVSKASSIAEPVRQAQAVDKPAQPVPLPAQQKQVVENQTVLVPTVEPVLQNQAAEQMGSQNQRSGTNNAQKIEQLFNTAQRHEEEYEYAEAVAVYLEILRLDPNNAKAYRNRGKVYFKDEDFDLAIAEFTQAIRINPNDVEAYNIRSLAYLYNDESDKAVADFYKADSLDPVLTREYHEEWNFSSYDKKITYGWVIAQQNVHIKHNPNDAKMYYSRGKIYERIGNFDGAISDYTQVIRLCPNEAQGYFDRARIYFQKGDNTLAKSDLERTLQLDPDHDMAREGLEELRQMGY
jgi:tetratricopeptide (TPR) repeat protein